MWTDVEGTIIIGDELVIESVPEESKFGVVFEDDSATGYFYAVETNEEEMTILDAVLIYNVDDYPNPNTNADIRVVWTDDNKVAALFIDEKLQAVFDFIHHGGYNKNEYPPINNTWAKKGRKITPEIEKMFL
jgi:hypothetical protein